MLHLMPTITTDDTRYLAALSLVTQIDHNICTGRRHYRTRDGQLLLHLDQVVNAILEGTLELSVGAQTSPQRGETTLC